MYRNKLILKCIIIFSGSFVFAQEASLQSNKVPAHVEVNAATSKTTKGLMKKYKLDFDDENVTGEFEAPDMMVMSTRGLMKYKELFNKRTNFVTEAESNKGMFK